MNQKQDFHKKKSGIVVNTNHQDFKRAKNRNFMRREQEKIVGEHGKVAYLENQIKELNNLVNGLIRKINESNELNEDK